MEFIFWSYDITEKDKKVSYLQEDYGKMSTSVQSSLFVDKGSCTRTYLN